MVISSVGSTGADKSRTMSMPTKIRMCGRSRPCSSTTRKRMPGNWRSRSTSTSSTVAPLASTTSRCAGVRAQRRRDADLHRPWLRPTRASRSRAGGTAMQVQRRLRRCSPRPRRSWCRSRRRRVVRCRRVIAWRFTVNQARSGSPRRSGSTTSPASRVDVDGGPAVRAGARPDVGAVHREDPHGVGVARMQLDREPDVADVASACCRRCAPSARRRGPCGRCRSGSAGTAGRASADAGARNAGRVRTRDTGRAGSRPRHAGVERLPVGAAVGRSRTRHRDDNPRYMWSGRAGRC